MKAAKAIQNQIVETLSEEWHSCPDPIMDAAEMEEFDHKLKGNQITITSDKGTFVVTVTVEKQ